MREASGVHHNPGSHMLLLTVLQDYVHKGRCRDKTCRAEAAHAKSMVDSSNCPE